MTLFSIIVAVYNAEAYLKQCLDSLISQTCKDIQIICVDDCSSDDSWSILQKYSQNDHRIEIYKMPQNSGQAKARNVAIRHAVGKYVAYLDSDDWMAPNTLEECLHTFIDHNDADCVILRLLRCYNDGLHSEYDKPIPDKLTGYDAFVKSLDWSIHGCYVARREFYEQWPYDDMCCSYSDDNITRLHYYHARMVYYAPKAVYYYRYNPQSVTAKPSVRRFDILRASDSMKRQLLELGVSRQVLRNYEYQRLLILVDAYMFYHVHGHELSKDDCRYGLTELKRFWKSLDDSLLQKQAITKFGYRPCHYWWLFRLQESIYFILRGIMNKNR